MTSKLLPEGTVNYNLLNDLCMIVIAGFDMGGEDRYRYTVRRMYEGYPDRKVYDGEVILYLNTKGNASLQLTSFVAVRFALPSIAWGKKAKTLRE